MPVKTRERDAGIVKAQVNAGRRREIDFFRDQLGLEVDFIVPLPGGAVQLVEARASKSVHPSMAEPMLRLATAWRAQPEPRPHVRMTLVHEPARGGTLTRALAPGVEAMPWTELFAGSPRVPQRTQG